jgi:lipopolysaccharide transport system permease protein
MESKASAEWDIIIKPQQAWWRPDLREFWHYRDLLVLLVKRDLTAQYKQTVLGPLWLVLQPLLTTLTYTVMFGMVARLAPDGIPAMLFYLSGVVPWTYFSGVVNKTSRTFVSNASVLTKVYFPRLIMPVSTTLSALFSFLVQLVLLVVIIILYVLFGGFNWTPSGNLLLLPLLILLMSFLGLGAGIAVSAMTTKYRDLGFLVSFGVQLLMFASPVIFPPQLVADKPALLALLNINPMTPLINTMRAIFFGGTVEWMGLAYASGFAAVLFLAGLAVFQRVERSFADVI